MKLSHVLILILFTLSISGCHKEWEEPDLYTVNLSLGADPDSVDDNLVYYYAGGMKLQMHLTVKSNGSVVKDEVWTNHQNYHWEEMSSVTVSGKVVSLSNDTALSIDDYPVIMRVYKNYTVLYEEVRVENDYSF